MPSESKEDIVRPGFHRFEVPTTVFEVPVRYELIKQIGSGAYGVVVSVKDKETGEKLAIKKIPNAFEDLVDAKRIFREIRLLRHFNHDNILDIRDLIVPPSIHDFNDIYIVNELLETDLHRVIYSKQHLTDEHIQYFMYQALRGLKCIHSANVIHRDLKPSNLLVNSDCALKICDFGLARGIMQDNDPKNAPTGELTEYVVTRWYRAPEIMLACRKYEKAIDIWALGCIFAELLGRKPLFPGDNYIHQLKLIVDLLGNPIEEDTKFITSEKALKFINGLPKKATTNFQAMFPKANPLAIDLLTKMLTFNPSKRYTVIDCLNHPYMASLHSEDDEPTCDSKFFFEYEGFNLNRELLQWCIYNEIRVFHKDLPEYPKPEGGESKEEEKISDDHLG